MRSLFHPGELQDTELAEPFTFTKGCPMLKIPANPGRAYHDFGTVLYDLESDPQQLQPIQDKAVEGRIIEHMVQLMQANDAPAEQFERLGL